MIAAADLAATAPLWLPMAGCVVVLLAETLAPGRTGRLPALVAGASVVLALVRLATAAPSGRMPFGLLADDALARGLTGVVLVVALAVIAMAEPLLERLRLARGEFHALLLASLSGMVLLVGARDLLALFLGIELLSIPLYVLAAFRRLHARSLESGFKYFLLGAFASGFLVYGIALLFARAGDTTYAAVAAVAGGPQAPGVLFQVGGALVLAGLAFKIAAAPFHAWTPDVYEGAPSPVTAFMAAGVKTAAFGALLRLATEVFPASAGLRASLALLACASMLAGNLGALLQTNLKRMLAWSSVAHAGYLLVGIVAALAGAGAAARDAVLFYLASYALTTLAAFAWIEQVGREAPELQDLRAMKGLARRRPWLALGLTVCLLSLAGVPLTAGFLAKYYLLKSAFELGTALLVPMLVLAATSVVALGYYLRVVATLWMERPADEDAPAPALFAPAGVLVVTTLFAAALVLFGLWPAPLLRWLTY